MKKNLINIPGWRTNKKIVVFESDDWGMIRTSSKKSYQKLIDDGYPLNTCSYSSNDSLEQNLDVASLYEVLINFKDSLGNHPIFTINNVVANPDFDKIKNSNFKEYHRECFIETYNRYEGSNNVFNLWKEGIKNKLVFPQYHATEHLNVNRWMKSLELKTDKTVNDAFQENMFSLHSGNPSSCRKEYLDAFGLGHYDEFYPIEKVVEEGLNIFEDVWGFRSKSFIAPCYIWPAALESALSTLGVKYIQGTHVQRNAVNTSKKFIKKYHFTGQKNRKTSQLYLVRNVFFEPTENPNKDWVNSALYEIELAFRFKKPAIISSHRVNYMGRLNPKNRENGLKLLEKLLNGIIKKWPEVEFMNTDQLGDLIVTK